MQLMRVTNSTGVLIQAKRTTLDAKCRRKPNKSTDRFYGPAQLYNRGSGLLCSRLPSLKRIRQNSVVRSGFVSRWLSACICTSTEPAPPGVEPVNAAANRKRSWMAVTCGVNRSRIRVLCAAPVPVDVPSMQDLPINSDDGDCRPDGAVPYTLGNYPGPKFAGQR